MAPQILLSIFLSEISNLCVVLFVIVPVSPTYVRVSLRVVLNTLSFDSLDSALFLKNFPRLPAQLLAFSILSPIYVSFSHLLSTNTPKYMVYFTSLNFIVVPSCLRTLSIFCLLTHLFLNSKSLLLPFPPFS